MPFVSSSHGTYSITSGVYVSSLALKNPQIMWTLLLCVSPAPLVSGPSNAGTPGIVTQSSRICPLVLHNWGSAAMLWRHKGAPQKSSP